MFAQNPPIRRMVVTKAVFVWFLFTAMAFADSNVVENIIQQTCALYHGVEYRDARKSLEIKQKHDDSQTQQEMVVLFTVEIVKSANSSYQFVCVLKRLEAQPGGMHLVYLQQLGARGVRFLDGLRQTASGIEIFGNEYGPNDPMYKPTVPCVFTLKNTKGVYLLSAR